MDAGGLAQMNSFTSPNELGQAPSSGLASRRGGQSLKPLSLATPTPGSQDNGAPTPRTSRSHLLAGLRTAPKSATTSSFPNNAQALPSPTAQSFASSRNTSYGSNQSAYNSAPKTAVPQFQQRQQQAQQQQQQQQALQAQQQAQAQAQAQAQQQAQQQYASQHFTMEQVLAPPEIRVEDQDQMDPQMYAQLVATNLYLAQQQRALQQELYNLQAAAQQFQGLSLGATQQQIQQQQIAMYQQQQRVQTMQQSMLGMMGQQQAHQQQVQQQAQQQVYAYIDPLTGQTKYYVDPNVAQQSYVEQQLAQMYGMQQPQHTPRVQVSPPAEGNVNTPFRTNSPPKRNESPIDVAPLPPPSANAFRRGHKKIASLAMPKLKDSLALSNEAPKSAGPRTSTFPGTPLTGSYMPGGGRAGEHPVRQPRGPPSIDELKAKPTTKFEGSKNFSSRARRSAVHNLVRAGRERRKGTGSSSGSMSPVSESAEESSTPITDNESDSGHSGSGSLSGEVDCPAPVSRTSTTSTWGAIGSDRPGSRQKTRKSLDSISSATSGCESDKENSFASVFKSSAQKAGVEVGEGQRKAPMMVLTSAEKRRTSPVSMA